MTTLLLHYFNVNYFSMFKLKILIINIKFHFNKAWTWTAPDFSEGEIVNEVFGLRFKTPDLANSFKKIVDKCQEDLKNNPAPTTTPAKAADKATEKAASKGPVSLADFAKSQKAASWECELCLTRTDNSKIQVQRFGRRAAWGRKINLLLGLRFKRKEVEKAKRLSLPELT